MLHVFQELGLVITGTLPVFNKTNTGSKVNKDTFKYTCLFYRHIHCKFYLFCIKLSIVSLFTHLFESNMYCTSDSLTPQVYRFVTRYNVYQTTTKKSRKKSKHIT